MIESIDFERLVRLNQFNWFKKMLKRSMKSKVLQKVNKIEGFAKNVNNILSSLLDLIESFELFLWVFLWVPTNMTELVHMYLVTWLNWLIYSIYTDSWWLNQYIFTFCLDWIDWFGMSRIQVWLRFMIGKDGRDSPFISVSCTWSTSKH